MVNNSRHDDECSRPGDNSPDSSTLYHVLASELLRSSSLVGKGRERNEVINKISTFFGGPLEKFEKWQSFGDRNCHLQYSNERFESTESF